MGTFDFDSQRGDPKADKRDEIAEALHVLPPSTDLTDPDPDPDETSGCLRDADDAAPGAPSEACHP